MTRAALPQHYWALAPFGKLRTGLGTNGIAVRELEHSFCSQLEPAYSSIGIAQLYPLKFATKRIMVRRSLND